MNNADYTKKLLLENEIIIIDTSAVMDYEELYQLVTRIECLLLEFSKKIVVPRVVWIELMRHINSKKQDKREKALRAVDILCMRPDIFEIESEYFDPKEMLKTFADAELLSELTRKKVQYHQLLITNDKKLSKDAFNLNNQESCHGHQIVVCYLSRAGKLKTCDCVFKDNEPIVQETKIKENVKIVHVKDESKKQYLIPGICISVASMATGIAIGKYNKHIIEFIKAIA